MPQKFLEHVIPTTNGTLLTTLTAGTGGGWSLHPSYVGNLQTTTAGRLRSLDNNYGLVLSAAAPTLRNQVFNATLRCQTNINYGLMAMRASATVETYYQIGYFAGVGWKATRFLAGAATQIGSTAVAILSAATDYEVQVEVRDHYTNPDNCRITITVDGSVVLDVTDTSPLTGTRLGLITLGPASDSTGCQWAGTISAWETYRWDLQTAGDGQQMVVIPPIDYDDDGTDDQDAVEYFHGAGEDYGSLVNAVDKYDAVHALWRAGYLQFGSNASGGLVNLQNWGNPESVLQYQAATDLVIEDYRVTRVFGWGQSMGGMSALMSLFDSRYTIHGLYLVKAACSLAAMYGGGAGAYQAEIEGAYDIASNGSDYATKTYGSDPLLIDGDDYPNISYRFVASPGDTLVIKVANTDPMRTALGSKPENSLLAATGDHTDDSHYADPDDIVEFFDRVIDRLPTPGLRVSKYLRWSLPEDQNGNSAAAKKTLYQVATVGEETDVKFVFDAAGPSAVESDMNDMDLLFEITLDMDDDPVLSLTDGGGITVNSATQCEVEFEVTTTNTLSPGRSLGSLYDVTSGSRTWLANVLITASNTALKP